MKVSDIDLIWEVLIHISAKEAGLISSFHLRAHAITQGKNVCLLFMNEGIVVDRSIGGALARINNINLP